MNWNDTVAAGGVSVGVQGAVIAGCCQCGLVAAGTGWWCGCERSRDAVLVVWQSGGREIRRRAQAGSPLLWVLAGLPAG